MRFRLGAWLRTASIAVMTCIGFSQVAAKVTAEEISLPPDTQIVARLDLAAFSQTSIGKRLVDLTAKTAAKEIGTEGENLLVKVRETLGFDPLTEIRTATIAVSDLEDIKPRSMSAVVQLGKTTGNLEGLLLALPGYSSREEGKYTLHSAGEDENERATGAIHVDNSGNNWLVVSPSEDRVMSLLGSLSGKAMDESDLQIETSLADGMFASVTLLKIPTKEFDGEPFENIVKSLRTATIAVAEREDSLSLTVDVDTISETRAKQLLQLVQGASAAVSLMFDSIDELKDEDLRAAATGALDSLHVEQDGTKVHVGFDIPVNLVVDFLREEADLPL